MINQDPDSDSTTQPSTPTTPISNNTFEQNIIGQDLPSTNLNSPPPAPRLAPADRHLLRENNVYEGTSRSERLAARLIGFVGFNLNQSCRPNKYLSRNPHDYNDKGNGSGRPSRASSMACC